MHRVDRLGVVLADQEQVAQNREEVLAFLEKKKEQVYGEGILNYFELFGIPEDSSTEAIQRAYFSAVKNIHPDRLERVGATECREEAGKIFQVMDEAYRILNDLPKRIQYIKALDARREGKTLMSPEEEAEIYTHRGRVMLKRGNFSEAEQFLRQAVERKPKDASLNIDLAKAVFQNAKRPKNERLSEMKDLLKVALEADKYNAQALYYLAMYHKATGDSHKQRVYLVRAVNANPDFTEAKREKRLLELRLNRKGGGVMGKISGFFSSLGKKGGKDR